MASDFGPGLRRLRHQAGYSLRDLARRAGVDFTYLSKVETGALPPPAAATIEKLARILRHPADKLLREAGKLPGDISQILLENENLPAFLRAASRQRLTNDEWHQLMRFLTEPRPLAASEFPIRLSDAILADRLIERLEAELPTRRRFVVLEMCGMCGHALVRAALANLVNGRVRLLPGPGRFGVLHREFLARAPKMALRRHVVPLAHPELFLNPEVRTSALGRFIQRIGLVHSPHEALAKAEVEPQKKIVLLAAGFETTAPSMALAAMEARRRGIRNFFLLVSLRSMLAAIEEVAHRRKTKLDGLIAPGHVAAIVGLEPFRRLAREYQVPIIVTGFETLDILAALLMLARQLKKGRARAENQYGRVVKASGNPTAYRLIEEVFERADGHWETLGKVPGSIFRLRVAYQAFDAAASLL